MMMNTIRRVAAVGAGLSVAGAGGVLSRVNCSSSASVPAPGPQIGIISGSGPDAGLDIFQKILLQHRQQLGDKYKTDKDAPNIMLFQVPGIGGPHGAWDLDDREGPLFRALWDGITGTISRLSTAGANCVCLPCNTLHLLEAEIREWMKEQKGMSASIEFVSIIDAVVQAILEEAVPDSKIGVVILGTLVTTDPVRSPYASMPSRSGLIEIEPVSQAIRERLQALVIETKRTGPQAETNRTEFWSILMDVIAAQQAREHRVIVLACSELPTLLQDEQYKQLAAESGCRVVDPNAALAGALLNHKAAISSSL
jgi:aspartate racemase